MNNIVGPPATGQNFFGREAFLKRCWERIPHTNLLLVAPRRTGKTSLMMRLKAEPLHGYQGVFVDLEGDRSAADMVGALINSVAELNVINNTFHEIEKWSRSLIPKEIAVELTGLKLALSRSLNETWDKAGRELLFPHT